MHAPLPRLRRGKAAHAWLALGILVSGTPALAALPKVPEGFKIRLVAAVPAVQYPCQVATAPDGSLFIAEDPMDQVGPADKPIDRILVFRPGKDEPVVYAEKLNAVFGMVWHEGSLYVMNMPNLTVLKDTDGDGKADRREELFTDLGLKAGQPNNFNDHIVSGLQIGIDNYLYISVGDKGAPKVAGLDGRTVSLRGGGVLRCRLDGTGLELFTSGTRNHLEPNLDDRDNLFTYDNTDDGLGWWTRVTYHVDGGYYGYPWDYHDRKDRMIDRIAEYGGGSPCGGLVYKEDAWPEKYRGRVFWTEWAKRVVRAFRFEPDGAGFKVGDVEDFIVPDQVGDFRPLDLALSHDGRTLYVADWGYGGWANKTEKLGRVYAVTYEGKIQTKPRGQDSDPVDAQIRALSHPSFNERTRGQRALARMGKEALGAVVAALKDEATDPVARRHLVWSLDAMAGATPEATFPLIEVLASAKPDDVRAQAARALGERQAPIAVEPLAKSLSDRSPAVRLQAVVALGRIGDPDAVPAILPLVADADPYISHSARKALKRINDWKAAEAGLDTKDPKVRAGVMLAMEMVHETDAVSALARFASDASREPAERAKALFLMSQAHHKPVAWDGSWWGTQPAKMSPPAKKIEWPGTTLVLESVRARLSDAAPAVRLAAVTAVVDERDRAALPRLRERFASETEADVKVALAKSFGTLEDREALPALVACLKDHSAPSALRDAALASVETIGSDEALTALLDLLETNEPGPERQPRLVAALGRFSSPKAAEVLLKTLKSPSTAIRASAAEALGTAGRTKDVAQPLIGLLADPSVEVRKAAVGSLGDRKERSAIPALLAAADAKETSYEATLALAEMPDPRAVRVYLQGLSGRSSDLRRASSRALASIRDEAASVLERLAERKELPSSVLPDLKRIYTRMRPVQSWNVLGPLPIRTEPPFSIAAAPDLKSTLAGFGDRPLAWKKVGAVDGRGQVDLGQVFSHDDDIAAFGYAEFDSPSERKAEFAVGSDDTLTVWLNGEKVYDHQNRRGFTPEGSRFDAPVAKGKNRLLIKCGNNGGGWQYSVAIAYPSDYAFLKGPVAGAFDPENFRRFAASAKGNAEHGRALFSDLKGLACVKCHAVGGSGGTVGPELTSVGAKYTKDEIIASVLYPSAKISSGYEPAVLALDDGRVISGIVKGENPDSIELEDADAKRVRVQKSSIEERKQSDVSIMPQGLAEGLTREDFADLIAYLTTLRDAGPSRAGER